MNGAGRFPIRARVDLERARRAARSLAEACGFDAIAAESVVLAVSELGGNILAHSTEGEILLSSHGPSAERCVQVESVDVGPGIPDIAQAMVDGYSTSGGLGAGLGAVERLMDEVSVVSSPAGATIVARKWPSSRS